MCLMHVAFVFAHTLFQHHDFHDQKHNDCRRRFDNSVRRLSRTCRAQHQGTPPSHSDLGAQRAILHEQ